MFPLAVRPDSGESLAQEWLARTVAWYGVLMTRDKRMTMVVRPHSVPALH